MFFGDLYEPTALAAGLVVVSRISSRPAASAVGSEQCHIIVSDVFRTPESAEENFP